MDLGLYMSTPHIYLRGDKDNVGEGEEGGEGGGGTGRRGERGEKVKQGSNMRFRSCTPQRSPSICLPVQVPSALQVPTNSPLTMHGLPGVGWYWQAPSVHVPISALQFVA